jgi:hypothetical protein
MFTDVSEECVASIFRVKEETEREKNGMDVGREMVQIGA